MSLMHLLAATRSIVNIRDRRSPYEMRRQNLLPKFGPIAHADGNDDPAAPAPEDGDGDAGGPGGPGAFPRTPDPKGPSQMNHIADQDQAEAPRLPAPKPPARAAFPRGRWSFFRSSAAGPVAPEHGAVQGELALDTVKVVRNDLNEADVEVVLARPAPAVPAPAVCAAPQKSKAPGGSGVLWGRISNRLFGASTAVR